MKRPARDSILDHEYDGIREYDNPLPGWWVLIFWLTVIWAAAYFAWYHLGPGRSPLDRHEAAVKVELEAAAAAALASGVISDENVLAVTRHRGFMQHGAKLFQAHCAECHGVRGEGGMGPNLTDDHWLHGGAPSDISRVLHGGILPAGMPDWTWRLREDEVGMLAAYVTLLHGTNPPGAKAPQGLSHAAGAGPSSEDERVTALLAGIQQDPAAMAAGAAVFATRCAACHGPAGAGLIGPNLTDDHFIHGPGLADVYRIVGVGVPEKGMLAWKDLMRPDELRQVAAYVQSLAFTNAAGGKAPEGEKATRPAAQ